mgnify:FL=1
MCEHWYGRTVSEDRKGSRTRWTMAHASGATAASVRLKTVGASIAVADDEVVRRACERRRAAIGMGRRYPRHALPDQRREDRCGKNQYSEGS